jgi:hypothetical protein
MLALLGLTVTVLTVPPRTCKLVDPLSPFALAVIVVLPVATPVATPLLWSMVAAVVSLDVQATLSAVPKFFVLPSLKLPTAVNCRVVPLTIVELDGVTEIELSVGATKNPWQPDRPQIMVMARVKMTAELRLGMADAGRLFGIYRFL